VTTAGDPRPPRSARSKAVLVGVFAALVATAGGIAVVVAREPEQSPEAFCSALEPVRDLDDALATDPSGLDDELAQLEAVQAAAPIEIADDVAVLAAAIRALADGAEASPGDPSAGVDDAFVALQPQIDQISTAAQRLGEYARLHCDFALEGTT